MLCARASAFLYIRPVILHKYYNEVAARRKTFELRKDEDDIQVGDTLILKDWDGEKYTGHHVARLVTYVLRNCPEYGLADGYCIIAMQPFWWEEEARMLGQSIDYDTIS